MKKIILLFLTIFFISCNHCPPADVFWFDSVTNSIRTCPEGLFDTENKNKYWMDEEGLMELERQWKEEQEKQRRENLEEYFKEKGENI